MIASLARILRDESIRRNSEPWNGDSIRNSSLSPNSNDYIVTYLHHENNSEWASFHRYRSCDDGSRAEKRSVPIGVDKQSSSSENTNKQLSATVDRRDSQENFQKKQNDTTALFRRYTTTVFSD